ncbi:GMC oxidoreductase [Cordyceps fumosorosea ARSEF 2679]|uniref:GMC oxidoreductase n=1 Tax=Cordyceps fumosorosea (strain ARSEF 2679) TaxID=1081104 RepID=A0A167LYR0_CORFA|nr:GMC oxidoreductase [Cordyceps fumosorosea ARSEF 2679]OAA53697.1 GMC oxidoreductase [Cordyceps fumosorosea ARSEF 2679]
MRLPQMLAAIAGLLLTNSAVAEPVDYIIVGGGTSGLLLANRLSRDPGTTVTVIDPGSDERQNAVVKSPNDWLQILSSYVAEQHVSVNQPHANNRKLTFYSGRGIGGTSLINGMTYIRGDATEFDSWEKLGNKGWNWETMMKYYKTLEDFVAPQEWQVDAGATFDPQVHGTAGDIHTCFNPRLLNGSWYAATVEAWSSLDVSKIKDVNSGSVRGFDVWPQTIDAKTNTRWDAASAFYWPISDSRANLKLINGTVTKLLWDDAKTERDGARASGVEYTSAEGDVLQLRAKEQIILAAGALKTPLILESSGIGQSARLEEHGIPVIVDLPGVGENLVDNPLVPYVYKSDFSTDGYTPYSTFLTARQLFGDATSDQASSVRAAIPQWAQQVVDRSNGALNVSAIETLMTLQHDLIFRQNATIVEVVQAAQAGALSGAAWNLLPFSRGSVHVSANGPAIDPRFLAVDYDLESTVAIGKVVRAFYNSSRIRPHVTGYLNPSAEQLPENASEEDWRRFVPGAVGPNNHPLGTASMMARELGGVVDAKLKVYGTANVRVVDASTVPTQLSGHLTATIYAIAERASEFILHKC